MMMMMSLLLLFGLLLFGLLLDLLVFVVAIVVTVLTNENQWESSAAILLKKSVFDSTLEVPWELVCAHVLPWRIK
jgi:hypothetical protein